MGENLKVNVVKQLSDTYAQHSACKRKQHGLSSDGGDLASKKEENEAKRKQDPGHEETEEGQDVRGTFHLIRPEDGQRDLLDDHRDGECYEIDIWIGSVRCF
jgi:hypothetical protein